MNTDELIRGIEARDAWIKELEERLSQLPTLEGYKLERARSLRWFNAITKIANDKSPPWDKTDFQRIAREVLE